MGSLINHPDVHINAHGAHEPGIDIAEKAMEEVNTVFMYATLGQLKPCSWAEDFRQQKPAVSGTSTSEDQVLFWWRTCEKNRSH
ncbi:hypothetical protein ACFODZ_09095 [Marinicella sediminis]|uniref:Uncharacterized protein n=1 Tax=Marinicella sediminis TaxID=1792834 RepID=A0ABV7J902_9GAMM|nr:hypothetical protein [Marinicella sediminis]